MRQLFAVIVVTLLSLTPIWAQAEDEGQGSNVQSHMGYPIPGPQGVQGDRGPRGSRGPAGRSRPEGDPKFTAWFKQARPDQYQKWQAWLSKRDAKGGPAEQLWSLQTQHKQRLDDMQPKVNEMYGWYTSNVLGIQPQTGQATPAPGRWIQGGNSMDGLQWWHILLIALVIGVLAWLLNQRSQSDQRRDGLAEQQRRQDAAAELARLNAERDDRVAERARLQAEAQVRLAEQQANQANTLLELETARERGREEARLARNEDANRQREERDRTLSSILENGRTKKIEITGGRTYIEALPGVDKSVVDIARMKPYGEHTDNGVTWGGRDQFPPTANWYGGGAQPAQPGGPEAQRLQTRIETLTRERDEARTNLTAARRDLQDARNRGQNPDQGGRGGRGNRGGGGSTDTEKAKAETPEPKDKTDDGSGGDTSKGGAPDAPKT